MRIDLIVGARPNFMKAAPVVEALRVRHPEWSARLIHTGQHYDEKLSDIFFRQLGMPQPDMNLGVGSGTHTHQTAGVMLALERHLRECRPDLVVVFGDVNSTFAAAMVATQLGIRVAHVEAGLRSYDREMPEEVNRVLTDALSDLLFTTERGAEDNLHAEGIRAEKIHFVGNTMIDTLVKHRAAAQSMSVAASFGLARRRYVVVTLHRPSNVDLEPQLRRILSALASLANTTDVVFPAHPRTVERAKQFGLSTTMSGSARLRLIEPLGYLEFLSLMNDAGAILTDSGGIQEEAVVLRVPCVTLRKNTERPVTVQSGGNRLAGEDPELAVSYVNEALRNGKAPINTPELWDGHAASRIVDVLERQL